jgi:hypothetical protein
MGGKLRSDVFDFYGVCSFAGYLQIRCAIKMGGGIAQELNAPRDGLRLALIKHSVSVEVANAID